MPSSFPSVRKEGRESDAHCPELFRFEALQICVFFMILYQRKEREIEWKKAKEASFRGSAF